MELSDLSIFNTVPVEITQILSNWSVIIFLMDLGLSSLLILFILPWLDTHKVKSGAFRPKFKIFFWAFIFNFILLGWLGGKVPEGIYVWLSRAATFYYYAYFFAILPWLSKTEVTYKQPTSIDQSVQ